MANIRTYGVHPAAQAKFLKLAKAHLIPVLKSSPGFRGYYVVDSGEGHITTVSLFTSKQAASDGALTSSTWTKGQLGELVVGPPASVIGEIVLQEPPRDADRLPR